MYAQSLRASGFGQIPEQGDSGQTGRTIEVSLIDQSKQAQPQSNQSPKSTSFDSDDTMEIWTQGCSGYPKDKLPFWPEVDSRQALTEWEENSQPVLNILYNIVKDFVPYRDFIQFVANHSRSYKREF